MAHCWRGCACHGRLLPSTPTPVGPLLRPGLVSAEPGFAEVPVSLVPPVLAPLRSAVPLVLLADPPVVVTLEPLLGFAPAVPAPLVLVELEPRLDVFVTELERFVEALLPETDEPKALLDPVESPRMPELAPLPAVPAGPEPRPCPELDPERPALPT